MRVYVVYRDVVSVQNGAPERHQLGEDGGAALQQRLHQAQEVQVDHLRQNLQQSHYQGTLICRVNWESGLVSSDTVADLTRKFSNYI